MILTLPLPHHRALHYLPLLAYVCTEKARVYKKYSSLLTFLLVAQSIVRQCVCEYWCSGQKHCAWDQQATEARAQPLTWRVFHRATTTHFFFFGPLSSHQPPASTASSPSVRHPTGQAFMITDVVVVSRVGWQYRRKRLLIPYDSA